MEYEIPKEIKAKPKLLGLEIRELIIIFVSLFFIFTVLKDMVHKVFVIPYFIVSISFLFYMVMPSASNPNLKNYMSIILFFKQDRNTYHALDHQGILNEQEREEQNEPTRN